MVSTRSSRKRSISPIPANDSEEAVDKAIKRIKTGEEHDDIQTTKDEKLAKKVVKHTNKHAKRKLDLVMSLPVDIFYMVASFTFPQDLLHMSRASKALRNILMSRSAKSVWLAAETNVGLPACPPDISCPQYASLLFDNVCTSCLSVRAGLDDNLLILRVRLCQRCFKTETVSRELLDSYKNLSNVTPGTSSRYISATIGKGGLPTRDINISQRHLKSTIHHTLREYLALGEDETKVNAYLAGKLQLLQQRCDHVKQIWTWIRDNEEEKAKPPREIRKCRKAMIITRLEKLGYTEDDFDHRQDRSDWKWMKLIDQPRELTDKVWNRILPELEKTIQLRREQKTRYAEQESARERKRLLQQRRALMYDYVKPLGESDSKEGQFCTLTELAKLPLVAEFLESDEQKSDFSREERKFIKGKAAEIGKANRLGYITKWKADMQSALSDSHITLLDAQLEGELGVLNHACAFFGTRDRPRQGLRTVTKMLDHIISEIRNGYYTSPEVRESSSAFDFYPVVETAKEASDVICLDSLSMVDVESFGRIFTCKRCSYFKGSWSEAVDHLYYHGIESHPLSGISPAIDCVSGLKALLKECRSNRSPACPSCAKAAQAQP